MKNYSVKTINSVAANEQGNVNISTYKVYTALLTQSGGGDPLPLNTGPVTQGVTYYIDDSVGQASDFTNVGGLPYPECAFSYFVATNSDTPNNYDGATLQYDSGAPTPTVLENTIGNIWFTYHSTGTYVINSSNLFTINKTAFFIEPVFVPAPSTFSTAFPLVNEKTNNSIKFCTTQPLSNPSNDLLNTTAIEIKVYN